MPKKECIFTEKAPEPGCYSQAVRYGNLVFLSGQVSEDVATGDIVKDSIANQTRRILTNIKTILEAAGSSLDMVLKVRIYVSDINHKPEMNEVYKEFFPHEPPARVAVAAALDDDLDVEIDVVAGIKENALG